MSEKIRVCVISPGMPYAHGGAELRSLRHTKYLRSQVGMDAMLVAWNQGEMTLSEDMYPPYVYPIKLFFRGDSKGPLLTQLVTLCLHVIEIYLRLGWFLFSKRKHFEIVHIIFAASWFTLIPISIAKLLRKPVFIEMTDKGVDDPLTLNRRNLHPEKQIFAHRPLKYRLFLLADAFVSKCQALSDAYLQAGLPQAKLFQFASAIDTAVFCPAEDEEQKKRIREKLGIKSDNPLLVLVGRIHPQKGIHNLLPAFKDVLKYYPKTSLLLIGPIISTDTQYFDMLCRETEKLDLSNQVRFVGRVSNVNEYLKAADIFVLPTSHEGFSGAILEAMAAGLPIITSDIPEIALSQIKNEEEGILVPVGDVEQLTKAMIRLLECPNIGIRLGHAARKRVEREFTFDAIGTKYIGLYKSLQKQANMK